jgi:DNA integrity scanning protein DisA with diadenylate cyclase activity
VVRNLLKYAIELAKERGIDSIVVISKDGVAEGEFDGVSVYSAPQSYAFMLESRISTIEGSLTPEHQFSKGVEESIQSVSHLREYISQFMSIKGITGERAVVVLNLETVRGILLLEVKESSLQKALRECSDIIRPEVLKSVIHLAMALSQKGREGKKVGTAFVIGDVDRVLKRSKQLVINPFHGHAEETRNITNPETWESIMEFAQLDGVFVVDERGIIVSAGTYIKFSRDVDVRSGLGGRHLACAAITKETRSVAVVVSESGGDITVYKGGKAILHIPSGAF